MHKLQAARWVMKHNMEMTVAVVRYFWRSKLVEGGSRAGKILRASFLKNSFPLFVLKELLNHVYHDVTQHVAVLCNDKIIMNSSTI